MAVLPLAACDGDPVIRWFPSGTAHAAPAQPSAATRRLPPAPTARFVKLVAVSELNGKPFTAVAEFNLLDATGTVLDRKAWKVRADSVDAADPAGNAIDGNPRTHWHSRWQGTPAPLPHELVVDLGLPTKISAFRYLPRQDNTENGRIKDYRLEISNDGVQWAAPVSAGALAPSAGPAEELTVVFAQQTPNSAPQLKPPAAFSLWVGQPVALALAATDPDSDPLTYSASGLPPGLALSPAGGVVSGTPMAPGRHRVQVTVADNKGANTKATFEWSVLPPKALDGVAARASGEVRFVKLEQLSEINGKPWASIAELNLADGQGNNLARAGWAAFADSAASNDLAQHAIDGNPGSIWHSQWDTLSPPPPPHSLVVDMRRYAKVSALRVLPRQDKLTNGIIARFRVYTSADGVEWGRPVAEGDFSKMGPPNSEKSVVLR